MCSVMYLWVSSLGKVIDDLTFPKLIICIDTDDTDEMSSGFFIPAYQRVWVLCFNSFVSVLYVCEYVYECVFICRSVCRL